MEDLLPPSRKEQDIVNAALDYRREHEETIAEKMLLTCAECAFCEHDGQGYSEYTITGEVMICMKGLREDIDTEISSNDAVSRLSSIATTCPSFHEGVGIRTGLYMYENTNVLQEWLDWQKANPGIKNDPDVEKRIALVVHERIKEKDA